MLHWVDGPEGRRYRLWQNTADEWCSDPLTREEFIAYVSFMPDAARWIDMLDRGAEWTHGPDSSHGRIDAWWLGSRASDCHSYGHCELQPDGSCWWCGFRP